MVDTRDLKSLGALLRAGSTPALGTEHTLVHRPVNSTFMTAQFLRRAATAAGAISMLALMLCCALPAQAQDLGIERPGNL